MWFTFQASWAQRHSTVQDQHSSPGRMESSWPPAVPQNQKQSRAFQGVFVTWNSISGDFSGIGPFCCHVFSSISSVILPFLVFFDLLIAGSFNNKCEFLSREQRETLEFPSKEQKKKRHFEAGRRNKLWDG